MVNVVVEEFDRERHGQWDDCDFVVVCQRNDASVRLGEDVAMRLSLSGFDSALRNGRVLFFCCHA